MSFSPREKVAEGRMRGGKFHLAVRPAHPILLLERSRDVLLAFSHSQKRKTLQRGD